MVISLVSRVSDTVFHVKRQNFSLAAAGRRMILNARSNQRQFLVQKLPTPLNFRRDLLAAKLWITRGSP